MRPDDGLGAVPTVLEHLLERGEHMMVAQIPGGRRGSVHQPVVLLGGSHHAGILRRIEQALVALQTFQARPQQFAELCDHGLFTGILCSPFNALAIFCRLVLPGRQAGVALASGRCMLRVAIVQITQHCRHRGPQAVDVQAAKFHVIVRLQGSVVLQPTHEVHRLQVAPHPGGEAVEHCLPLWGAPVADVAVDVRGIRPVALYRDDIETVVFDQPTGDARTRPIEFGGAVAGLANQHHTGIAIAGERYAKFRSFELRQGFGVATQQFAQFFVPVRRVVPCR